MRLATIVDDGTAVGRGREAIGVLPTRGVRTVDARRRRARRRGSIGLPRGRTPSPPRRGCRSTRSTLGPAVPDPGAIYTIGHNYRPADEADDRGPPRPLVYGKAAVVGRPAHGATLAWDRTLTAERRRGVRAGRRHRRSAIDVGRRDGPRLRLHDASTTSRRATRGSTATSGCSASRWPGSARSARGSSRADELDPPTSRLGCTVNGEPIQDGRTPDALRDRGDRRVSQPPRRRSGRATSSPPGRPPGSPAARARTGTSSRATS